MHLTNKSHWRRMLLTVNCVTVNKFQSLGKQNKKRQIFSGYPSFFAVLSRPNVVYKQTYETTRKAMNGYIFITNIHWVRGCMWVSAKETRRGGKERDGSGREENWERKREGIGEGGRVKRQESVGMTERQGRVCLVWGNGEKFVG